LANGPDFVLDGTMSEQNRRFSTRAFRFAAPLARAALATALLLTSDAALAELRSVGVERANFRLSPAKDAEVLFTADRHYPVEILEVVDEWILVRDFEGDEAWVAGWLLGQAPTVVVTEDVVNIRAEPSTEGTVVHTAERGAAFVVVERRAGWVRIADEIGPIGWVHKNLLWGSTE
jgi:SH3-like domain-containing protein